MTITPGENLFAISRERDWDWRQVLDLSTGINPLGPAPGVRPAIEDALDRIGHYPGPAAEELESLLAEAWGIAPELVLAGAGPPACCTSWRAPAGKAPALLLRPRGPNYTRHFPMRCGSRLTIRAAGPCAGCWP